MYLTILSLLGGFVGLFIGGEILVLAASNLALILSVSEAIVATTIVAFGSSLPELLISIFAALQEKPDLAVGNVVGSNIQNIALVLGAAAIVRPFPMDKDTARTNSLAFLGSGILLILLAYNQIIGRIEGIILLLAFFGFVAFTIKSARKHARATKKPDTEFNPSTLIKDTILIAVGLIILFLSARLTVYGASEIATIFGISDRVIGLTVVAFGTSLPELFICVVASYRKKAGIIVGNILGSNIYNVLAIIGTSSVIFPLVVSERIIKADMPIMLVFTIVLFLLCRFNSKIGRFSGVFLMTGFFIYIYRLFLVS